MALTLDLTKDYLTWDNTEPLTFTSVSPATPSTYTVETALGRAPTYKEQMTSGGVYTAQDKVWLIPRVLLGVVPKPGDVVTDGDETAWTVLEAPLINLKAVYKLMTRDLILAHQLTDTITIEVPTFSGDAGSALVRAWTPKYENLAARVQPVVGDEVDERGVRGQSLKCQVFIAQQIDPTDGRGNYGRAKLIALNWLAGASNLAAEQYLDITGYHNPGRIDEIPVIDTVRRP